MESGSHYVDEAQSYREFFEQSPDAILIIEGDRFVNCNPAAVHMLRFPDKQALLERFSRASDHGGLSAHPADISPPNQPDGRDSYEKAEEYMEIAFDRGNHTFEWEHLCADGESLLVEVQLTVVRRGEKPRLHVVWRDIRERKRMEEELRRAQRLESVGRLAGGIAHDFNNILMVIISFSELLENGIKSGKPDPKHVAGIQFAANRATNLTRRLLTYSRGQPAQLQATDVGDLVEQLGGLLRRLIGEHIELDLKRQDGALTVMADPSQLEQLVVNLSANSQDAMPNGGRLTISVSRHQINSQQTLGHLQVGDYVVLRVTDTGIGMTSEQIDRAFDPFYTSKILGKGTGLGLASVQAIAKQYSGHASIESVRDQGTKVQVWLPLCYQEPVPFQYEPIPKRSLVGVETILLVEDEENIRKVLEEGLIGKGYQVLTAQDGKEALDRFAIYGKSIDLLISDVVMPHLSGPELVQRLMTTWPMLKVIFMSGYIEESDLKLIKDVEQSSVLQKPFALEKLYNEIRKILDCDRDD